ncbi:MAG: hypothetical protein ACM3ZV_12695 [Bacillota bacterium]
MHQPIEWKLASGRAEVAICAAAFAAALILSFLTRTVPFPSGDVGIFQSVAYRLLAGDRLYVDVYDNKDPLFYYFLAAQVRGGPFFQYLAETLLALGTGWLVAVTARRFHPNVSLTLFTACWLATAYICTGWFWTPGMPAAPGIFLAQAAITAIIFGRPAVAGLALAATLFTDVIFFPPAAAFVLLFCLLCGDERQDRLRRPGSTVLAGAAGVALVAAILLLRGEFAGYLAMLANNVLYTHDNWQRASTFAQNARNHLAATLYFGKTLVPAWTAAAVLLFTFGRRSPPGSAYRAACLAGATLFPVLLLESAQIVIFDHHLAPWHLLVLLALALVVPALLGLRRQMIVIPLLALATLSLFPLSWESKPANDPLKFGWRLRQLGDLSPETRLLRAMAGDRPATYARLGTNNDFHHALGTVRYRLACPEFQQYEIYSVQRLNSAVRCGLTADYLIVDVPPNQRSAIEDTWLPPYTPIEELNARWLAFRSLAYRAVSRGYQCRADGPDLRVCRKLSSRS